ncbi:nuclease [Rhynchospora pubera]|nr:nuclease [Rhynchospora pubera]
MSQNVMAVVDFDGNFLYVVAGWEGSAHDNLVLRKAIERGGFKVPPSRYYLVDGGYANTPQFLSPYRGKTYHLAQFSTRSRENRYDCAEELYNHRHAQLRNIVEKTFGILKGRFKICKEMHRYKYDIQTDLVIACCILHNFIKRHQHDNSDDDFSDDEVDSDFGSGNDGVSEEYRGTDTQVGGAMRDKIRDMLWDNR